MLTLRLTSLLGFFVMIGVAWLLSTHRRRINLRILIGGVALQFALALLIMKTSPGYWVFSQIGKFFEVALDFVNSGSAMVFGENYEDFFFAFKVLPTIIFFSSLMAVLYHFGLIQRVVRLFAVLMEFTLGTSGAETLSAAANVFVGQTEAPLVVRPYVASMTMSELNAMMVGGFATIAGGVLAAYVGMGIDATHLVTASVISAPAALVIAKVMLPETEKPRTLGSVTVDTGETYVNAVDAAAKGAGQGLKLALNVGAMLIAFLALVAMCDWGIAWVGERFGYAERGQEIRVLNGHNGAITSVTFSPDGKWIASASDDDSVMIWDAESGQPMRTLKGHTDDVNSVSFSPDGKWIASGSDDNTVKVWDAANGQQMRTLEGHADNVSSVSYSRDGKWIASASDDDTVMIWDAGSGQQMRTLKGHADNVTSVSFSPDGNWIASGSGDRTVKIWDAADGQHWLTLKGHTGDVNSISFSPDGKWIASGSDDNTVKIWDPASGQQMRTLEGHSDNVRSVSFSPNGSWITSVSGDGVVVIGNADSGQTLLTLEGLASVSFSPNGTRVASGSPGPAIRMWDMEDHSWSLAMILGYLFYPFAWLMGIESADCFRAAELLGMKIAVTEFIAYDQLHKWMEPGSGVELSKRTVMIVTYALCGFANFGSIGIQLGGIGGIAPKRRGDLARLGMRAMIGGSLAAFMTACIAGALN
jgi:nucleoside transporter